jgi:hypothetical protein
LEPPQPTQQIPCRLSQSAEKGNLPRLSPKETGMTIPFEEFKAKSLADPEVKREYDALAPEFEALAESIRAKLAKKSQRKGSRCIVEIDSNLPSQR